MDFNFFRSALGCIALGILLFLIFDVGADKRRLTSAGGVFVFLLLGFLTSTDPARVGNI